MGRFVGTVSSATSRSVSQSWSRSDSPTSSLDSSVCWLYLSQCFPISVVVKLVRSLQQYLTSDSIRFVFSVSLFLFLSISLSVFNKWALRRHRFPMLLLSVQFFLLFIISGILVTTVLRKSLKRSEFWITRITVHKFAVRLFPVGIAYGMDILFTTLAINHGPIAFVEMIKSGTPVIIVIVQLSLFYASFLSCFSKHRSSDSERINEDANGVRTAAKPPCSFGFCYYRCRLPSSLGYRKLLSVGLLSVSELLIFYTEVDFNWISFTAAMTALFASAMKLVFIENLLQNYSRRKKKSRNKSNRKGGSKSPKNNHSAVDTHDHSANGPALNTTVELSVSEDQPSLLHPSQPESARRKGSLTIVPLRKRTVSAVFSSKSRKNYDRVVEDYTDGDSEMDGDGKVSAEQRTQENSSSDDDDRPGSVEIETFELQTAHEMAVQMHAAQMQDQGPFARDRYQGRYFDSRRQLPVVGLVNLPGDIDFLGCAEPPLISPLSEEVGSEDDCDSDDSSEDIDDGYLSESSVMVVQSTMNALLPVAPAVVEKGGSNKSRTPSQSAILGKAAATNKASEYNGSESVSQVMIDQIRKQKHGGIHSILALFYFMPVAMMLTVIGFVSFELDDLMSDSEFGNLSSSESRWKFLEMCSLFGTSAILAFALNWTELLFLQTWSAITLTVMGGVKLLIILLVSWAVFDHSVTGLSLWGYLLCTLSVVLYNWTKLKSTAIRNGQHSSSSSSMITSWLSWLFNHCQSLCACCKSRTMFSSNQNVNGMNSGMDKMDYQNVFFGDFPDPLHLEGFHDENELSLSTNSSLSSSQP